MKVSGLVGTNLSDGYTMKAQFDNVNGLKPRAKVTMSGVTIGTALIQSRLIQLHVWLRLLLILMEN